MTIYISLGSPFKKPGSFYSKLSYTVVLDHVVCKAIEDLIAEMDGLRWIGHVIRMGVYGEVTGSGKSGG